MLLSKCSTLNLLYSQNYICSYINIFSNVFIHEFIMLQCGRCCSFIWYPLKCRSDYLNMLIVTYSIGFIVSLNRIFLGHRVLGFSEKQMFLIIWSSAVAIFSYSECELSGYFTTFISNFCTQLSHGYVGSLWIIWALSLFLWGLKVSNIFLRDFRCRYI